MITDEELILMIEDLSTKFVGQIDDLQVIVGMLSVGRLYGWRVTRLVSTRRHWKIACQHFGDLKELLPERGILAHKSVGLSLVDKMGDYWDIINGNVSRDSIPLRQRKMII